MVISKYEYVLFFYLVRDCGSVNFDRELRLPQNLWGRLECARPVKL